MRRISARRALLLAVLFAALCAPASANAGWITSGPEQESRTDATEATFTFEAPGATRFVCGLDGEDPTPCESPKTYTDLDDGWHLFAVTPLDGAGAGGTQWRYWYVDLLPPDTIITRSPGPVSGAYPAFGFDSDEEATFECSFDGAAFSPCWSMVAPTSGLADGPHSFALRAIDLFGRIDPTPAVHHWTVDATPPQVTLVSFSGSATTRTATLTFASLEPGVTFRCSVSGRPSTPCTSPHTWRDLPTGPLRFAVHAYDAVGNWAQVTRRWTLDPLDLDGDRAQVPQDCRDDDPAIHPGAFDIPGDGIDQDCDGRDATQQPVWANIVARWRAGKATTRARRLLVTGLTVYARVTIRCRGKGCPIRSKRLRPDLPSQPKPGDMAFVDVRAALEGRPLRAGTTLTITVKQRRLMTKVATFRIRKGRPPAGGAFRCLPDGATTPVACPAVT